MDPNNIATNIFAPMFQGGQALVYSLLAVLPTLAIVASLITFVANYLKWHTFAFGMLLAAILLWLATAFANPYEFVSFGYRIVSIFI